MIIIKLGLLKQWEHYILKHISVLVVPKSSQHFVSSKDVHQFPLVRGTSLEQCEVLVEWLPKSADIQLSCWSEHGLDQCGYDMWHNHFEIWLFVWNHKSLSMVFFCYPPSLTFYDLCCALGMALRWPAYLIQVSIRSLVWMLWLLCYFWGWCGWEREFLSCASVPLIHPTWKPWSSMQPIGYFSKLIWHWNWLWRS